MRKEATYSFVLIFILLALAIVGVYYIGGGPTGYAIFEEYTNEADCVIAGYAWENLTEQNCTIVTTCVNETIEIEPCLEDDDINGTQVCINWTTGVNETCTDEEECVDVIRYQCIGEICDADNLELCLDEGNCTGASGYWYNETCNVEEEPSCSNDAALCLDEGNCTSSSWYWYEDICNTNECASDDQCDSGYECSSWSCTEIEEEEETTTSTPTIPTAEEPSVQAPITSEPAVVKVTEIQGAAIPKLLINPGSSRSLTWKISNTGDTPLSACKIKALGEYVSWFSIPEDTRNLNAGAKQDFAFDITVPEDVVEGTYSLSVSAECFETAIAKDISVEAIKKRVEFEILDSGRTSASKVRVIYSITELIGEDQDVEIYFSLLGLNNQEVSNVSVNKSIGANATREFRTSLSINKSLEGNLSLSASFNSQVYSSSVQETVALGTPIAGFAIFGGGLGTLQSIIIVVVVLAILIIIFVIVRKARKSKRQSS